jgi:hypothetical protein
VEDFRQYLDVVLDNAAFWGILGILVGALVTFLVSRHYYRAAAQGLRWEGRASHASQEDLDLLVAYHRWKKHLRESEAICIGEDGEQPSSQLPFKYVLRRLQGLGFANLGRVAFMTPQGQENAERPGREPFRTIMLKEDGIALAEYLLRTGRSSARVQKLYRIDSQKQTLLELLWSADPDEPLGEVKSPPIRKG